MQSAQTRVGAILTPEQGSNSAKYPERRQRSRQEGWEGPFPLPLIPKGTQAPEGTHYPPLLFLK